MLALELCFISRFAGCILALVVIVVISVVAGRVKVALVLAVIGGSLLAATHYWPSQAGLRDIHSTHFLIVLVAAAAAFIAVYFLITRTGA